MPSTIVGPECKDCRTAGITTRRPAPYPGPRCASHHREKRRAVKDHNHGRMIEATYGITPAEYRALYTAQGGVCAICQRATGKTRRLAVDHNHQTGEVRGLLCKTCNWIVIGRYSITMLCRAIDYLMNPPARAILRPEPAAPTEKVWIDYDDGHAGGYPHECERPIK